MVVSSAINQRSARHLVGVTVIHLVCPIARPERRSLLSGKTEGFMLVLVELIAGRDWLLLASPKRDQRVRVPDLDAKIDATKKHGVL